MNIENIKENIKEKIQASAEWAGIVLIIIFIVLSYSVGHGVGRSEGRAAALAENPQISHIEKEIGLIVKTMSANRECASAMQARQP